MAALDPRFEFAFGLGAPTAASFNAANGTPLLTVAPTHFLYVASSGDMPAATVPNRFEIPWTNVWIAVLKVCNVSAALGNTHCSRNICNLRVMHDSFARCVNAGMPFTPVGSLEAALAAFVRFAHAHAQSNPAAWELNATHMQVLPAVPAATLALPPECES